MVRSVIDAADRSEAIQVEYVDFKRRETLAEPTDKIHNVEPKEQASNCTIRVGEAQKAMSPNMPIQISIASNHQN